jgi:hypothetical protein
MNDSDPHLDERGHEPELDLNQLLTPNERELYRRHLEVRNSGGGLAASAGDMTKRMLHLLVTENGRGNHVGGLHLGRGTVLPLLVDVLVGPEPDVDAWIEAVAGESFDLSRYAGFGKPGANQGSPGTLLPRLLQRYERAAGRSGPVEAKKARDLRTALSMLIAATLVRELRKATTARAALGSAWPLMHAVSQRKDAELRRFLADFGGDRKFLSRLRSSIETAVDEWKLKSKREKPQSTNEETQAHLPAGVDVKAHFKKVTDVQERRAAALVKFGKLLLLTEAAHADDIDRRALERLAVEVPALTGCALPTTASYLDDGPAPLEGDEADAHKRRLNYLMPIAAKSASKHQVIGRALSAVQLALDESDSAFTGLPLVDRVLLAVGRAVFRYARDVGPPPPAAPIEHLGWFEASACYLSLAPQWPAREAWRLSDFELRKADKFEFNLLNDMAASLPSGLDSSISGFDPFEYTFY